ncbi:putative ATPase [Streptomyces luteogriseus]|uniref:hypothetical protein n=1 Tax=Streptomyces luteogriseus TaxID=68233 RepID=UPI002789912A|nr:hypothetical protein [Streptomyces luteogriseus]MDQ0710868.1 putative ATPase [Streptomyces luteogriseus]
MFSGGFGLQAAETVCAGEGVPGEDVLDLLAGLVDKSIVAVNSSSDRARCSLLETIRQYGRQRLQEEGGATRVAGAAQRVLPDDRRTSRPGMVRAA